MLTLNETMLEEVSGGATNTAIFAKVKLNLNSYNGNNQKNTSNIGNGNKVTGILASGFIANSVQQVNSVG